jgi:hypothetical protein
MDTPMINQPPPYLDDGEPVFIKLASHSKAPQKGNSASEGPFYRSTDPELRDHIKNGGNVGRVLRDDMIAFDVDHQELLDELEDWPETLVIKSGGDGVGYHYYYRCPGWNENQRELRLGSVNIGGVRSGNSYCLAPPSVHDETGNRYTVETSHDPAEVSSSRISGLLDEYGKAANTGGGGGGGGVGGSPVPSIPSEYPNRSADWERLAGWLSSNGLLSHLDKTASKDWSGVEFAVAKCLAEGGFSEDGISDALDRLTHKSKWHSRGSDYQKRTVRKAIVAACDDEFVDFSDTGDMGAEASESRKTEFGSSDTEPEGGENMTDFTEKETVQVKEGDSDGDRAIEAVRVEGQDGSDEFEFVSIRKGRVRSVQLTDGSEGLMVDTDETNGKSVGGTADLDLVIEALTELRDELN